MLACPPHMKMEKKPRPYFPVLWNPLDINVGNSCTTAGVDQREDPKSRNGPVSTCSDIPTPLSSTSIQCPMLSFPNRTMMSPQLVSRCCKALLALIASAEF